MNLTLATIAPGLIIHGLIYLLIIAVVIGLIYWIGVTVFPARAPLVKTVCVAAFLIIVLLLLLQYLNL